MANTGFKVGDEVLVDMETLFKNNPSKVCAGTIVIKYNIKHSEK